MKGGGCWRYLDPMVCRKRRPKRRCMDAVKEDMGVARVTEEDEHRVRWSQVVHRGDSQKKQPKDDSSYPSASPFCLSFLMPFDSTADCYFRPVATLPVASASQALFPADFLRAFSTFSRLYINNL